MLSNFTSLPVSAFIFRTLNPNMHTLFTVIPLHITSTIHCIQYTPHLKPLTVNSGEMHCYITMIHTD